MPDQRDSGGVNSALHPAPSRALEPQIIAFARACKTAARFVGLYPPDHPSVAAALESVARASHAAASSGPLRLGVLPDTLTLEDGKLSRDDAAVSELAALMHTHIIGQLTVHDSTSPESWRRFLGLIAATPDQVRSRGGVARLWALEGRSGIEVKEIDYSLVLLERLRGDRATWDSIIADCLEGEEVEVDGATLDLLLAILDSPSRINDLETAVEHLAAGRGVRIPVVLAGLMRSVAELVGRTHPDRLETALSSMSEAAGHLRIETLLPLFSLRLDQELPELGRFVATLARRMSPVTAAQVVARSIAEGEGASARLAQAFSALVPEMDQRDPVLTMAHDRLSEAPAGQDPAFSDLWTRTRDLLLNYSDQGWVDESYGVEFGHLQAEAVDLEHLNPDPPDRVAAWLDTVSDDGVQALDAQLLEDLLQLEADKVRRHEFVALSAAKVDDLVLRGHFKAAGSLVEALNGRSGASGGHDPHRGADDALGPLIEGPIIRHVVQHLAEADEKTAAEVRRFCQTLGTRAIRPLAEVLSTEERQRARERLVTLLLGFGADGRQAVERLRQSPNPAVRRTAVQLLREFGGHEALPDLELLLDDKEPDVQSDATRAIALLGSNAAFAILTHALLRGSGQTRRVITGALWALHDESVWALFEYLLANLEPRGAMRPIYERTIQRLAAVGGDDAVAPLTRALKRGEWWAPFRTAAIRAAAAEGLARVGTVPAVRVLEEAIESGPGGVRRAAQAALEKLGKASHADER